MISILLIIPPYWLKISSSAPYIQDPQPINLPQYYKPSLMPNKSKGKVWPRPVHRFCTSNFQELRLALTNLPNGVDRCLYPLVISNDEDLLYV
jgi:hypothetical protein